VEVRVTELDKTYRSLDPAYAVQSLSEIFALYLTDYSDVGVFIEGEPAQLSAKSNETSACNLGHPFVAWVGDDIEQFLDTLASDRRDDPELG